MLSAVFSRPLRLAFLTIVLGLTACTSHPASPAAPSFSSPPPTRTSPSSATATPTNISALPTLPPKWTETPTPTITETPTPSDTPTPTFVPTLAPATPAAGPEGYRLKQWTEQEALAVVSERERMFASTSSNDISNGDAQRYFGEYLLTMERETLRHFPQAASKNDLLWKLANLESNTIWYQSPIHHFLLALEAKLNSGEIAPLNMSDWLKQHGFGVPATYSAHNLFGDGKDATVYFITAMPEFETAVITLGGSRQGEYRVFATKDHWTFLRREYPTISIEDRSGNGQPEIQLIDDWYGSGFSGGICTSDIYLYEWQGSYPDGKFVNLAQYVSGVAAANDGSCGAGSSWEFGSPDANGSQSIIAVTQRDTGGYASRCADYESRGTYTWTGRMYEWAGNTENTPSISDPEWCAVLWADWAGGLNDRAVVLLNAWVQTWPSTIDEIWGESAQDYFRFKLGTWYALRGDSDRAQSVLQMVRDHPANPKFTIASQMAGAYLEKYQSGFNLVGACGAASETLNHALLQIPNVSLVEDLEPETMRQAIGFAAPYWFYPPHNVCDLWNSFRQTIRTFTPHDIPEVINWLNKHRVGVWVVKQADLNDDGMDDRVARLKLPGDQTWNQYALIQDQNGLNAVFIPGDINPNPGKEYTATLTHFKMGADSVHVNVFTFGDEATAFQILERQGQFRAEPFPLSELTPEQLPPLTRDDKVARAEQALFESGDITQAIETLKDLLAGPNSEPDRPSITKPRLLYLLGLAHELSGNERDAVQAYWQLWHDYPDNPYTLMARRKLEAITP